METTEIKQKEHRLAEKAQGIYEHWQKLESLESQKANLLKQRPTADKEQLSYIESIEFGKKIEEHKKELKDITLKIQKLTRELNALKKQAEKLLPAPGVKIKVSTHPDDDAPVQTFCIQYIKSGRASESEDQFEIKPLQK
ncbi:MAG: hypothetical protein JXR26_05510 [Balneolaceae bacterium]|nr:hypothetical protein [Balneolaceae bacterium]